MGLYNVVAECVAGGRHYVRPTTAPEEFDDAEAAGLVTSGCLTPYRPGGVEEVSPPAGGAFEFPGETGTVLGDEINVVEPDEAEVPKSRTRRRAED